MSAIDVAKSGKSAFEIEIAKLKENNKTLHEKLQRAYKALALSRAYPLLKAGEGYEYDSDEEDLVESSNKHKSNDFSGRNGKKNGKKSKLSEQEQLDELFDSDEDKMERLHGKWSVQPKSHTAFSPLICVLLCSDAEKLTQTFNFIFHSHFNCKKSLIYCVLPLMDNN